MRINYPKNETVCILYQNTNGELVCVLTRKLACDFYFLYEVASDGELKKLGKARSPTELEEKFNVSARMWGTEINFQK